jgi:hypothetical protein
LSLILRASLALLNSAPSDQDDCRFTNSKQVGRGIHDTQSNHGVCARIRHCDADWISHSSSRQDATDLSTIVGVQRAWAILVLSLMGLLPIAPALTNATRTIQVPLCCRAHGKHKCAMRLQVSDAQTSDTSPGMYSVCDRFPWLQPASSTAVNPSAFLPEASQLFFAAIVSHPAAHEQTEARFRISFARSRQKRGPPSFLS